MLKSWAIVLFSLLPFALQPSCVTTPDESPRSHKKSAIESPLDAKTEALLEKAERAKVANPFLWRVEKDGKTSYLFGTIHIGVPLGRVPRVVVVRLMEASLAVFESDPRQTADDGGALTSLVREREKELMLPDDASLREHLSPEAWARLITETGLPSPFLDRLKPYAARFFFEFMSLARAMTHVPRGSLDVELLNRSLKDHKPVLFLETPKEAADQLVQALGLDGPEAAKETFETLDAFLRTEARTFQRELLSGLLDMILAYKTGKLSTVQRLAETSFASMPGFQDVLIGQRNARWLPNLEKSLGAGGAFVAVGVLHMPGEQGLIRLLERDGFEVNRL